MHRFGLFRLVTGLSKKGAREFTEVCTRPSTSVAGSQPAQYVVLSKDVTASLSVIFFLILDSETHVLKAGAGISAGHFSALTGVGHASLQNLLMRRAAVLFFFSLFRCFL